MHKFSTWSLSFRTKSTRRPFSQSWNIFTFFRVSRWTWIAISAFSLSGNISNTDQSEASIILCQPIKSEYVTWLFIHGLFVWPEIVKPLDNSLFQVSTNLPANKNFQTLQLWMFHFQMTLLFQQPHLLVYYSIIFILAWSSCTAWWRPSCSWSQPWRRSCWWSCCRCYPRWWRRWVLRGGSRWWRRDTLNLVLVEESHQ